jgi:hypothetical protein
MTVNNVDRTRTDADVIEHVLGGIHLGTGVGSGGGVAWFDTTDAPWLAGTTKSEVAVHALRRIANPRPNGNSA